MQRFFWVKKTSRSMVRPHTLKIEQSEPSTFSPYRVESIRLWTVCGFQMKVTWTGDCWTTFLKKSNAIIISLILTVTRQVTIFWSGRKDLNLRPPQPHCGALPSCATPRRHQKIIILVVLILLPIQSASAESIVSWHYCQPDYYHFLNDFWPH